MFATGIAGSTSIRRISRTVMERALERDGWTAYLYDPSVLVSRIQEMRSALPEVAKIFFAIKVNPHESLLQAAVHSLAGGVEIASQGEGMRAISAGFSGQELIFSGPAKSAASLSWAVENDLKLIHVESLTEAARLNTICGHLDKRQDVLIRVNPAFSCEEAIESFGGTASKIGMDQEMVPSLLPKISAMDRLRIRGIHMYAATNVLSVQSMLEMSRIVFAFVRGLEKDQPGFRAEMINLGGGFGIDYSGGDDHFDIAAYGAGLAKQLRQFEFDDREVIVEPGRWIAAPAGWYATEIVDIKVSRGRKQVICAGGANHFRRPVATGCNHPCAIVSMGRDPVHDDQLVVCDEIVDVSGPLCTTVDRIAHDLYLDHAEIGDVIVFSLAGAYGLTLSHTAFLGHDLPEEIVMNAGAAG